MLQQETPDDYVIATGQQFSVRKFIELSAQHAGMDIEWKGEAEEEVGIDKNTGKTIIMVNPKYYRPTEVETLLGDATKAKEALGWVPKITLDELVEEMIKSDLEIARLEALVR